MGERAAKKAGDAGKRRVSHGPAELTRSGKENKENKKQLKKKRHSAG